MQDNIRVLCSARKWGPAQNQSDRGMLKWHKNQQQKFSMAKTGTIWAIKYIHTIEL